MDIPRVVSAHHVRDHVLDVTFADGVSAQVDLWDEVVGYGGILEALHDVGFFAQVRVDEEVGALVWPNDADICPELLYRLATHAPAESAEPHHSR